MRALLILTALALAACTTAPKDPCQPISGIAKSADTRKTTGRWIVWSKLPAAQTRTGAFQIESATLEAQGGRKIEGLNAFVYDKKPMVALTNSGWVVQPEYVHHILAEQLYRITPVNCPEPGPNPNPEPNPNPQPNPEPAKSWGVTRVHAPEAMAKVDTSQVKVCVIDTGIDQQHPQNGEVIGSIGYAGAVQDRQGHGTHVAGTIAGRGGVGVSRARLLVCKGLSDSGSGSSQSLAQCLAWCGQQGAHIVSNSWGSPQSDPMINNAINLLTQKGIYVFVAAGNDSGPVNWPAKLAGSNPLVYAVAASDQSDRITGFSSRGPEIRFISPGARITSSWPAGVRCPSGEGSGTCDLDGTSMSTPHVAAICAFGIAKGIKPCVKMSGSVGGFPMADALESAR